MDKNSEDRRNRDSARRLITAQELRNWMVPKIAKATRIDPRQIGFGDPFTSFGLTSTDAVIISGDLEDWLGCDLSPALLYDYPSIDALARHLAEPPAAAEPPRPSNPEPAPEADSLNEILTRLEPLSEIEAEALLEKRAPGKEPRGEVLR